MIKYIQSSKDMLTEKVNQLIDENYPSVLNLGY